MIGAAGGAALQARRHVTSTRCSRRLCSSTYAYSSYLLAQGLGLSGIVADLCSAASVMAHYTLLNLSHRSSTGLPSPTCSRSSATCPRRSLFVYVGLADVLASSRTYNAALDRDRR
jgi:NhaP-type Na+/H+ or K+/H+ antiporter